jgi:hypothetical protein
MMRKVLIGTPCHDGKPDAHYTCSLTATARLCIQRGIYQRETILAYDSIIQNARNDLFKIALENDFDDLIFIDADQGWDPEWVVRLLGYPVDVVGGTVRKKTDEHESYNVKSNAWPIPVCPATGLLMPDSLGAGFLRFSRKAMQALWDSSEPYRCMGKPSRWIFDIRPINGELVGEDTMVSGKLQQLGFQTYLDPSMTCWHVGPKVFRGDFAEWLQRESLRRDQVAA